MFLNEKGVIPMLNITPFLFGYIRAPTSRKTKSTTFKYQYMRLPRILLFLFPMLTVVFANCQISATDGEILAVDSKILSRSISVQINSLGPVSENSPFVYITDGRKMVESGTLDKLRELTGTHRIPAAHYVFVSSIDSRTGVDHRNEDFFCNPLYAQFFGEELVPLVESQMAVDSRPKNRILIGISFGALNAAYFSGRTDLFSKYALLSPITYPCDAFLKEIAFSTNKSLKIYISTGTNDAEAYIEPLKGLYLSKGYELRFIKTRGQHDFQNWNGQLETAIIFLNEERK
ncbi:hypothetical protein D7Z94_01455 [Ulvibacterium marinum]|uniref:Esterase family protein n=2 Tax=Ulvibacterium marinum TaxID=2419782 RepID=A0A3B0CCT7_9FLAO|nr:hypothetical protein D7Z94_01455 [Ulvibacterium marinum]